MTARRSYNARERDRLRTRWPRQLRETTAASGQTILLGTLPLENVASFVYVRGLLMSSGDTEEEME